MLETLVAKLRGQILANASNVRDILEYLKDLVLEVGCEHREEIERAAKEALDELVAYDLPWVPNWLEGFVDAAMKEFGYRLIERALDRLCEEN